MTATAADCVPEGVIAASREMKHALQLVRSYVAGGVPVLLVGPTGSGKEVLARHAHASSGRRGTFVDINCGALPRELIEALLFGSRRGAFTGSVADLSGHFEQADGGTVYLDELCSLPLESQSKLLRVLETRELRRLGEDRARRVDVLIVASVQDDPHRLIARKQLRDDLYYRLAVGVVRLPGLAERPQDIDALAVAFAARHGRKLTLRALAALRRHSWPGNVRELQAVIRRVVAVSDGGTIREGGVREALGIGAREPDIPELERQSMLATCLRLGWDIAAIAKELRLSRATVYRRMAQYDIRPKQGAS